MPPQNSSWQPTKAAIFEIASDLLIFLPLLKRSTVLHDLNNLRKILKHVFTKDGFFAGIHHTDLPRLLY
uniref:Maturase K n=1 Tax=Panagrolaimus sp. JU765 TaxID=591449 RepID=A0AC34R783_9BILA